MEITLNLPDNVYRSFTRLAEKKRRRVEEIISDRLESEFSSENPTFEEAVADWSDADVLALANIKLPVEQANRMSELSALEQRGSIGNVEKSELEMYLEIYNQANLRKACGIAEAVRRGLIVSADDLK